MSDKVDLLSPVISARPGEPPLVIEVRYSVPQFYSVSGPVQQQLRQEHYVRLGSLPDELRQRVINAVNVLKQGF